MGYDTSKASARNVVFAYDLALAAARDLWALAGKVRAQDGAYAAPAPTAQAEWRGPKRTQFDQHLARVRADATAVAAGLESTAKAIAQSWARARGEQDRINKARYVDAELDDDNLLEDAWEWFVGETDYGPPPGNPPVPSPPDFSPTRKPMYAEYERRG